MLPEERRSERANLKEAEGSLAKLDTARNEDGLGEGGLERPSARRRADLAQREFEESLLTRVGLVLVDGVGDDTARGGGGEGKGEEAVGQRQGRLSGRVGHPGLLPGLDTTEGHPLGRE